MSHDINILTTHMYDPTLIKSIQASQQFLLTLTLFFLYLQIKTDKFIDSEVFGPFSNIDFSPLNMSSMPMIHAS